jgi:hypothetical protein
VTEVANVRAAKDAMRVLQVFDQELALMLELLGERARRATHSAPRGGGEGALATRPGHGVPSSLVPEPLPHDANVCRLRDAR